MTKSLHETNIGLNYEVNKNSSNNIHINLQVSVTMHIM